MSTDMVKTNTGTSVFSKAGLPSVDALKKSLRNISVEAGASGTAILKMDRTGCWVFGANSDEVEEGSLWAVNPYSFLHGYIAWGDGEVLGEYLSQINEPLPEPGDVPKSAEKGWQREYGFMLRCISGDDKGLDVRYMATSVGGKNAVAELSNAIGGQVDKDPECFIPIVKLESLSYKHKTYGKIFTPVFHIEKWMDMGGIPEEPEKNDLQEAVDNAALDEAPAEEATRRRRRHPAGS